ncbi:carbon monoxide dehydrogenase subunit G [Burkholderia sp. Ac-20365]|uniref:CoxG family protein n=1 Tax=Burkholderia sp. Ac-20365 TaxID=2703897 RepID=UPI00197B29D4|nr:carbon monoxide dehydrogenase subunit G [Burkholderia sp. Ac-20365]MBN3759995.1 carbon monoxide dehydrogenase subunit G [Burkholderia sp. Ac-20365]
MELTETYTLPVPQQKAWEALNDTEILRASIPGCDSIEPDGENAYAVALSASVGPVKARFKGRMELTDIDAPHTYTIVFEGQGGAAGFGKGQTHVKLEPEGDDATKLTYTATAQVGGKLAQIGSRLVDGAARKLAGEFFRRFGEQLTGGNDNAQAETIISGDTASPADESEGATDGSGEETKRKKSWTAWISKS